jgi:hypothetical protein
MLLLTRTDYSSSRSPIYLGVSGGLMELVKSGVRQLLNLLLQGVAPVLERLGPQKQCNKDVI